MSDDPIRWRDAVDPPEGALELMRSLDGPPPLPPPMRASVGARVRRATKPKTRWVGPTTLAVAAVIGGLVIWRFSTPTRRPAEPLSPDVQVMLDEGLVKPREQATRGAAMDRSDDRAPGTTEALSNSPGTAPTDHARTAPDHEMGDETGDEAPRHPSEGRASADPSPPGTRAPVRSPRRPATEQTGYGTLTVNSMPWAAVRVDGDPVGNTPIRALRLRAGRRHVVLEVIDGRRYETWVNIGAGTRGRIIHQF